MFTKVFMLFSTLGEIQYFSNILAAYVKNFSKTYLK